MQHNIPKDFGVSVADLMYGFDMPLRQEQTHVFHPHHSATSHWKAIPLKGLAFVRYSNYCGVIAFLLASIGVFYAAAETATVLE